MFLVRCFYKSFHEIFKLERNISHIGFSFLFTFRLTAFVMRVFCKAQQFAGVNIDENLVCESVNWLLQNQRADGALPEVLSVLHREMVVINATQIAASTSSPIVSQRFFCARQPENAASSDYFLFPPDDFASPSKNKLGK